MVFPDYAHHCSLFPGQRSFYVPDFLAEIGLFSGYVDDGNSFGLFWRCVGPKKDPHYRNIITTAGFSLYSFSFGFWQFMLAEFILGIGQSFISGSDSAMLYDTLKEENREHDYLKFEGRVTSIGNFSEAIAGILGGLLATLSLRIPFICQAGVSALAIPAAFTLVEPAYSLSKRAAGWDDVKKVIRYTLHDHPNLRRFILFSSLAGTATLTYAWFVQPFLIESKLPLAFFGLIWTLLNLTAGSFSMFAYRVERKFSQNTVSGVLIFLIGVLFILTGAFVSVWAIPLLFLFYGVRGIATPVFKDYIHIRISSEYRATVLSLRNMFIRILFAVLGPVLGWITDHYSLKTGLVSAGFFFMVLGFFLYYVTYSHRYNSSPSQARETPGGKRGET